jgi:hypothetical protein
MGFIPIIVTLGGACLLFIIVVGNYLSARRKQIEQLRVNIMDGLKQLSLPDNILSIDALEISSVDKIIQEAKQNLSAENKDDFKNVVLPYYKSLQVLRMQYNQLIIKKPYSFVAKIRGFQILSSFLLMVLLD